LFYPAITGLDLQITSIALEADAVLLTHNRQHFERLLGYPDLILEDWL
jgi:predicted nucleic acid-binding protein